MISLRELSTFVGNRADFYDTMLRNGFFMPQKNSKAATLSWMYEVFRGHAWCPKQSDIQVARQVAKMPRRDTLLRYFTDAVVNAVNTQQLRGDLKEPILRTVEHMKHHCPDPHWLLNVIGLIEPEHEIFAKGYQPPKKERKAKDVFIEDTTGFFVGLPAKFGATKRQIRLPPVALETLEAQMARLSTKEQEIRLQITHIQRQLRGSSPEEESKGGGLGTTPRKVTASTVQRAKERSQRKKMLGD